MNRIGTRVKNAGRMASGFVLAFWLAPAASVSAAPATIQACLAVQACLTVQSCLAAQTGLTTQAGAPETVDGLVAKGRALLAEGKASEAQQAFEAAEKLDGSTIKTRMWTLRSWVAQARVNDALNEIDKLDRAGQKGSEMDYLYGIAFAAKAKGYMQERASGSVISMAFDDAVNYLKRATTADPVRYSDAFMPLAESAWYAHDLDVARAAADKAVSVAPQDPDAYAMLGLVAFAQFRSVNEDSAQKAQAEAAWEAARAANVKAIELYQTRKTPESPAKIAASHVELAHCFGWKKMSADVSREYAAAIAADPNAVDYKEVFNFLAGPDFLAALEAGEKAFVERAGAEDKSDATLMWWLGYARLAEKKYPEAEAAFQSAVTKNPEFFTSWFYIGLARYNQQKYEEAIAAFRQNFTGDPGSLIGSIEQGSEVNMPIVEFLAGWSYGKQKLGDAVFMAELEVAIDASNARYWNNLGLFRRDASDALKKSTKPEDKTRRQDLSEKALVAYERAVDLSPDDPNYLNDLAVVLHYNLHRDLERAKSLYEKAHQKAEAELKRKDLSESVRADRETALKDSQDNLDLLTRELEKSKKDPVKKDGGGEKGGAGDAPH